MTLTRLSNVIFADGGTLVPAPARDGNIETPYATLVPSIAACPSGGVVKATPASYSAEGVLAITRDISLVGMGSSGLTDGEAVTEISIGGATVSDNITAQFSNVRFDGNVTGAAASVLFFRNCNGGGLPFEITGGIVRCSDCDGVFLNALTTGNFEGCTIVGAATAVSGNILKFKDTKLTGTCAFTGLTGIPQFTNCEFDANSVALTFTNPGSFVIFDEKSWQSFVASACTIVNGKALPAPSTESHSVVLPATYAVPIGTSQFTTDNGSPLYVQADCLVCCGTCDGTQPDGLIFTGSVSATGDINLFVTNTTGAEVVLAADVVIRWRVFVV